MEAARGGRMTFIFGLVVGLFVGTFIGLVTMCIMTIENDRSDRE